MPRKTPVPDVPSFGDEESFVGLDPADPQPSEPINVDFDGNIIPDEEPYVPKESVEPELLNEVPAVSRALVVAPPSNSVIVGMGMLASMDEADYEAKKAVLTRGIARVKDLQQTLMVDKEDYGRVPGIAKPFLQLSGAEKLAIFYGFAVRQESERVLRGPDEGNEVPALTYRSRAFVHLGSFDGPVVAMGDGEANSHEDKYRYRFAKATCPKCGREGLIRGKPDGKLAGKWWCPGREGGCNSTFEPAATNPDGTPVVAMPGKVENTDPHGLAETLLQISAKRAFVAAIRRATGTSGLFSQDDDSPSVRQQSESSGEAPEGTSGPVVENVGVPIAEPVKGGVATQVQHDRLKAVAKDKGLNGAKIADLLARLFGMDVEPTGAAASAAVKTLNADQFGQLLQTIETGEVPMPTAASVEREDPVAYATYPDDIGAK